MTSDDKTEAFASWLHGQGIALTAGERSLVAGFVAIAGRRPVCAADVAQGIELARDAAISDDAQLEQLGARLLAFEAQRDSQEPPRAAEQARAPQPAEGATTEPSAAEIARAEPPPTAPEAVAQPAVTAPSETIAQPAVTAPPETIAQPAVTAPSESVAPLKIKIRTTTHVPVVVPAVVDEAFVELPVRDGSPRRGPLRKRTRMLVAGGAALAAAAVAGAIYVSADRDAAAPVSQAPAPRHAAPVVAQRLRRLDLGVRLPTGWREASDAELGGLGAQRDATVVFRGAMAADPEHGVFVAAAPGSSADLIATARTAERGVIRQLGIDASAYHPAGCALVELGSGHAARCRGLADHRGGGATVEIYVRAVGARNIVALSLARPSQASAAADAAAIVASFTP